jgi:hypothetical protein
VRTTVYSEQRARLLGISLRAVQGLALMMTVVAAWVVVGLFTGLENTAREAAILYVMVLVMQAAVLVTITRWTLQRLPGRGRDARSFCLTTAGLTLLASLPLLTNILGIVVVFVGIFLLTLALRTDSVQTAGPAQ